MRLLTIRSNADHPAFVTAARLTFGEHRLDFTASAQGGLEPKAQSAVRRQKEAGYAFGSNRLQA